jgi:hypothetical protein
MTNSTSDEHADEYAELVREGLHGAAELASAVTGIFPGDELSKASINVMLENLVKRTEGFADVEAKRFNDNLPKNRRQTLVSTTYLATAYAAEALIAAGKKDLVATVSFTRMGHFWLGCARGLILAGYTLGAKDLKELEVERRREKGRKTQTEKKDELKQFARDQVDKLESWPSSKRDAVSKIKPTVLARAKELGHNITSRDRTIQDMLIGMNFPRERISKPV